MTIFSLLSIYALIKSVFMEPLPYSIVVIVAIHFFCIVLILLIKQILNYFLFFNYGCQPHKLTQTLVSRVFTEASLHRQD